MNGLITKEPLEYQHKYSGNQDPITAIKHPILQPNEKINNAVCLSAHRSTELKHQEPS